MGKPLGTVVAVDDNEVVTGTGLRRAIYDAISTTEQAFKALPSLVPPPTFTQTLKAWTQQIKPIRLNILRAWARQANAHAEGVHDRDFTAAGPATPYVVLATDDVLLVSATLFNIVLTMPLAATFPNRIIDVKNLVMNGFNSVPTRSGADLIDGATTATIAGDYSFQRYISDGVSNWYSI